MQVMFEVHLVPDADADGLLSDETRADTGAMVMTLAEAAQAGFRELPTAEPGQSPVLVVVGKADERRIQNALEANPDVIGFRVGFADR